MKSVCANALDLIGQTPLIALQRIHAGPGAVFAKAEFVQPGASVKDRAALQIIREAYASGKLRAGQPVVEMTSGNMGAGLAVVCNVLGNPFIAVMSEGNSLERVKMLTGLGVQVALTKQVDGVPGQVTGADIQASVVRAKEIAAEQNAYYVDQFNNPGSTRAHEQSTGPEIWQALGERLDAFVAAVGSGGTFVGTSRYLRRMKPSLVCAVVEPAGSEVLAGKPVTKPRHVLQGTGYGSVPPHWDPALAGAFLAVTDDEAIHFKQLLAEKEGLYVGFSAAANVCAAVKLIASGQLGANPQVVTILCDSGLKYS